MASDLHAVQILAVFRSYARSWLSSGLPALQIFLLFRSSTSSALLNPLQIFDVFRASHHLRSSGRFTRAQDVEPLQIIDLFCLPALHMFTLFSSEPSSDLRCDSGSEKVHHFHPIRNFSECECRYGNRGRRRRARGILKFFPR